MNDVPNCKHDQGYYLCTSPTDPTYWMLWSCANRCGTFWTHHPETGMSYPRKPNAKPQLPLAAEGLKLGKG